MTKAIIKHQRAFLDKGPEHIEPLKMQQIADQVGVHVTTVSRAVDDKWVQTPRGVFPLKRFFGGGTQTATGEEVAWETIKQKLLEIIDKEDKSNPLSDEDLVTKLQEAGYPVARRTVTKYRKMLQHSVVAAAEGLDGVTTPFSCARREARRRRLPFAGAAKRRLGHGGPSMAILETHGLVKFYRGRKVVDGVSFEVDVGEIVGLLGPNGAGKTTSFRMITGQVTPNGGAVLFNGRDVAQLPMFRRARLGLGYLPQQTSVFRKLTVEQNILAILEVLHSYRSLGRRLTRAERYKKTDEMLERFGLSHLRKNNASRLSGGETRRLEIARCLVCDPLIILLDEPFAGIDPQTVADIQQIIRSLKDQGIGILVTDHQVREILAVTDRIYVVQSGKVLMHGTPQQIVNDPTVIKEYLGSNYANENVRDLPLPTAPSGTILKTIQPVVQEPFHTLIDQLKTTERAAAAFELLQYGDAAIPVLLGALERRDVELRLVAFELLKQLIGGGADFDPHAPEAHRRRQLTALRERLERKAG